MMAGREDWDVEGRNPNLPHCILENNKVFRNKNYINYQEKQKAITGLAKFKNHWDWPVAQQVNPIHMPAVPLLVQLLLMDWESSGRWLNFLGPAPHVGDPNRLLASTAAIRDVNQGMEDVCLSPSLCKSGFQIKIKLKKKASE